MFSEYFQIIYSVVFCHPPSIYNGIRSLTSLDVTYWILVRVDKNTVLLLFNILSVSRSPFSLPDFLFVPADWSSWYIVFSPWGYAYTGLGFILLQPALYLHEAFLLQSEFPLCLSHWKPSHAYAPQLFIFWSKAQITTASFQPFLPLSINKWLAGVLIPLPTPYYSSYGKLR